LTLTARIIAQGEIRVHQELWFGAGKAQDMGKLFKNPLKEKFFRSAL
jgi:hypothetical protein